uniref:Uncharacterized protein n=1 Tax=Rhizophora mucronata TaxID=61149 RepID=A0A2P2PY35_RHIMU
MKQKALKKGMLDHGSHETAPALRSSIYAAKFKLTFPTI